MEDRIWIPEEEVGGARLEEICRRAGYTTSVDQDGDLVVHGDVVTTPRSEGRGFAVLSRRLRPSPSQDILCRRYVPV